MKAGTSLTEGGYLCLSSYPVKKSRDLWMAALFDVQTQKVLEKDITISWERQIAEI